MATVHSNYKCKLCEFHNKISHNSGVYQNWNHSYGDRTSTIELNFFLNSKLYFFIHREKKASYAM